MEYERVSEKEWEEIILKSDNAYFFSSPTWAKIIEKSFEEYRTATRLYHINGKSILIPMMEKNTKYGFKLFESMPDEGLGGFFSESEVTTDDFRRIVKDIIGNWHIFYLALPPFENVFSLGKLARKIKDEWNFKNILNYTHILNLEGKNFEDIWKNYNKKTRGAIRKATKSGVEIKDGSSLDDFKDFYNIWSKASKNWEYQETYSFKFFHNLHKYGSHHVKLSLATKDNKTIAGLISLHYAKTIYYYYGASIDEYRPFNPTSLLFNNIIKQACQEDYEYINFGHSMNLKGLKRFKEGFGAEEVEIKRYLALSNGAKILNKIEYVGKTLKNRFISK